MINKYTGYLIKNADLYNPKRIGLRDILIIDQKIIKIAEKISNSYDFIKTIDVKKKKVIPGLIDQHVHLIGGGGEGGFASRVPDVKISDLIESGITTVVGVLGADSVTKSLESLLAKTKEINDYGIKAYCLTGAYDFPSPTLFNSVKKDIVFINEIIGCKLALSDHRSAHVSKSELLRLASQVRIARLISGKNAYIKLHIGEEKTGLKLINEILNETDIPIGIFRPTHVSRTDALLAEAVTFSKKGGYIDFTAKPSEEFIEKFKFSLKEKAPLDMVTFSSDGMGSWSTYKNGALDQIGHSLTNSIIKTIKKLVHKEILSLEEALPLATSNVANALGLEKAGTIEINKHADILVIDDEFTICEMFSKGKHMINNKKVLIKSHYE